MKKKGILHKGLNAYIGASAHKDRLMIGDAGMPIPQGVETFDLALKKGVPGFIETLEAVLEELEVEKAYMDRETEEVSPEMYRQMIEVIGDRFPVEKIPHEELKEMSKECKGAVRTGEYTPFSNIILISGTTF